MTVYLETANAFARDELIYAIESKDLIIRRITSVTVVSPIIHFATQRELLKHVIVQLYSAKRHLNIPLTDQKVE